MPLTAARTADLGVVGHDLGVACGLEAAGVAGVAVGDLLGLLARGEHDLGRVDHDDVVAGVDVGGEDRLVLAPQQAGDLGGHATEHQPVGVDDVPGPRHVGRLGRERGHPQRVACRARRSISGPVRAAVTLEGGVEARGRPPTTGTGRGAGRCAPASDRCRARSTPAISPAARRPRPTSTMVPTSDRTIWWQNELASISKRSSPSPRSSPPGVVDPPHQAGVGVPPGQPAERREVVLADDRVAGQPQGAQRQLARGRATWWRPGTGRAPPG